MGRRHSLFPWTLALTRSLDAWTRSGMRMGEQAARTSMKATTKAATRVVREARQPPPGEGDWIAGLAMGPAGVRRYRLFRPPGLQAFERVPLLVMLHGCQQDAKGFATATRVNRLAARERFMVLFVEQDRRANVQGCWNWFDTRSGRAHGEAALVLSAVDQVLLLYPADRTRVAIAGLSAGASMAALVAARYPTRFRAVVMHSGVPPGSAHSSASALSAMHGLRGARALSTATDETWPPLLVIHGTHDRVVSPANARAAVEAWAQAAGAHAGTPRRLQRGTRHAVMRTDYRSRGRTVASLCEIDSLGHAWSGGAARQPFSDARGPDASRLLWAFVSRQFEDDVTGR